MTRAERMQRAAEIAREEGWEGVAAGLVKTGPHDYRPLSLTDRIKCWLGCAHRARCAKCYDAASRHPTHGFVTARSLHDRGPVRWTL